MTEVERSELHAACERRGMSDGEPQALVANVEQRLAAGDDVAVELLGLRRAAWSTNACV
jgi:hypothetical protein